MKVFDILEVPQEWREQLSEKIANEFSIRVIDCITDPYDKMKNGDQYSSVLIDLDRFAKMIIMECSAVCAQAAKNWCDEDEAPAYGYSRVIKEHFGIEE